jgi:chromosome partitioning protein
MKMKVIATASQKGGSGKTTLSVHLAVAASKRGLKTLILDTDPQGSSTAWGKARERNFPTVAECTVPYLPDLIEAARADRYDLVIIDGAPHNTASVDKVIELADLAVIPVKPTLLDLHAVHGTIQKVKRSGKPFTFVLNECRARSIEVEQASEFLGTQGEVAPQRIGDRTAYSRALASGLAVIEFEPSSKAAVEIEALYDWIESKLKTKRRKAA